MPRRFPLAHTLACVAFAALGAFRAAPADAVVFNSSFDPVDFSGTATFDVSPGCLAFSGTVANDGDACSVTWLSATATLTDDDSNAGTLQFQPGILPSATAVQSIFVVGGELAGVDSLAIGPAFVLDSADPDFAGPWWIQYVFTTDSELGLGIVHLFHGGCRFLDDLIICDRDDEPTATAQVLSFTRVTAVPEPATLALLLGTLAAFAAARRKRGG
jgi:hypothetical protein